MQENLLTSPCSAPSDFQDFFSATCSTDVAPTSQTDVTEASVAQAALLLGITERSVWRRIKAGRLKSKLHDGKAVVLVCQSDVRPTNDDTPTDASATRIDCEVISSVEAAQASVHAAGVENEHRRLLEIIENQAHQLKAAGDVIMYMRSQIDEKDDQIKLLTDSQHKAGWWRRVWQSIRGASGG